IPKIMHRTSQNATIPYGWQSGFDTCVDKNPDWQHMFWTDVNATEFMQTHYESFMTTWHAYEYPIQRVDALRYHLLWHYGGVYADLDVECRSNLDLLIDSTVNDMALLPRTTPIGISNDVMAASKNHPFFKQLIDGLVRANIVYPSGYLTVMASTGPMFVNYHLSKYLSTTHTSLVKIISPELYHGGPLSFFGHLPGSSWHTHDANIV
ncbi:nucleotide-diphospho-sugar transferase, partial [Protomyces lactucae-debilis]